MILDGKKLARTIEEKLKSRVLSLGRIPVLVIVTVGQSGRNEVYVQAKKRCGERIGVEVRNCHFEEKTRANEIVDCISGLASDDDVDGIIIQLPLPVHLSTREILDCIPPKKDVDGLTRYNMSALYEGSPKIVPATARGVMALLDHYGVEVDGARAVVIGRSLLAGKPIAHELLIRNATVVVCHSHTKDISALVRSADIVVSATGFHGIIGPEDVQGRHVLVDVGIISSENGLIGDIDEEYKKKALHYSPVPGGVGPMTVVSLFSNLIDSAERRSL